MAATVEEQRLRKGAHGQNDVIMDALREQSTHYAAGTRITQYERLGLNKPGFWADWQRRKKDAEDTEVEFDNEQPRSSTEYKNPFKSSEIEYQSSDSSSSRKPRTAPKFDNEASANGVPRTSNPQMKVLNAQLKKQQVQLIENQGTRIMRRSPVMGTTSLDVLDASTVKMAAALSSAYRKAPAGVQLSAVATEYYFAEGAKAAELRHSQSYASNASSNFIKVYDALQTASKSRKAKGNTGKLTQTIQKQQQVVVKTAATRPTVQKQMNLNLTNTGYSSSYPSNRW